MKRRSYNATSLERVLALYERAYGISSADFYRAHEADDDSVASIPGSQRQSWAIFYREWFRLSGEDGFVERVERSLEPVC